MINILTPPIAQLPDLVLTSNGAVAATQMVTRDNIEWILQETGYGVRLNVMTNEVEFYHAGWEDLTHPAQMHMECDILDTCTRMRIKAREVCREILGGIAHQNRYHPMEDWIKALPPVPADADPIGDLIASVQTDNTLWPTYIENWLIQAVEGICGWRRPGKMSLPHVLVFVGGQGVGKTEWFRRLGGPWIKSEAELHLNSSSGKDHQISALQYPMVELSELDGIFRKTDISHMKSFISRDIDALRVPYAKMASKRPRMTSLCASVNEAEFLNDSSGSRRFWPINLEGIDWSYQIDLDGIWRQAYDAWQANPDFNLTPAENTLREQIGVEQHTLIPREVEDIMEFYRRHNRHPKYPSCAMNRSEILRMIYGEKVNFGNKQIADIGRCLADIIGKHKTIDGKQRAWLFPFNEMARDRQSWPDINHLTLVKTDKPETPS